VKEWFKSVLNNRSYPKNKTGYPFFEPPFLVYGYAAGNSRFSSAW